VRYVERREGRKEVGRRCGPVHFVKSSGTYVMKGSRAKIVTMYEGRSINKFQNGAIPTVLKIGKIRNIRFVANLILNIHTTFLDDDVIIMTSSDNRTQSICVLYSPSVYCHNPQVINGIRATEKNEKA